MKPLQAHFLKLAVNRLNARAMSANQRRIFNDIAGHIAVLFGNKPHAPVDITQLLVLVADVTFISHRRAAFRQGS